MIKLNNEAKTKLPEFFALTKLNDRAGYVGPTEFKTSNHGDLYGWPGTCKECGKVWCISVAKMEQNCLSRNVFMMMERIKKYMLLILALKSAKKKKIEGRTLNEIL
jgi:hypothetical protein